MQIKSLITGKGKAVGNYIYKTRQGEKIVKDLYDRQVGSLGIEYEDIYVNTRFGRTHVLKTGNPSGKPIILFHGGNSTAAYSLKQNLHLVKDYLVYAPDTIGHPGKSDQRVLSSNTLEYGQWASDVIASLGFEKIICMGESFGGGILAKLILSMGIPMAMYIITKNERWFEKAFSPMTTENEPIDNDTLEMIRTAFHHVKVNPNMPSNGYLKKQL